MSPRLRCRADLPPSLRAILAIAGRLVPRPRRRAWRDEWEAELAFALSQGRGRGPRLVRRALLAVPDALALRFLVRGTPAAGVPGDDSQGGAAMLADLLRDARVSARSMRKQPGFAGLAIATAGLGIGAATTIFGLVNGVLIQPLSYPEPERLVAVWPAHWFSGLLFDLLEEEADSYDAVAAWRPGTYTELDDVGASRLWASRATGGFFRVLASGPAVGRTFAPTDDEPGSAGGVVLSHDFWQARFGGDSAVIGRPMRISHSEVVGGSVPILGVMPPRFSFRPGHFEGAAEPSDIALTVPLDPASRRYGSSEFKVIGRLKPGVSREQAKAELDALIASWRVRFQTPDSFGDDAAVQPLKDFIVAGSRPTVLLLFGAVGLILVIATINVGNLLLARVLARHREVAVRRALGATTGRIFRQLFTESTLLALCGCVVGLAIAAVGVRGVRALLPSGTPRLDAIGLDGAVLGFCAALALVTGWVIGLLPALQSRRAELRAALGGDARGTAVGRRRGAIRSVLLASEIGLAVVLLTTSGGLAMSFLNLTRLDPGFRAEGLLNIHVVPLAGRLDSWDQVEQYYRDIVERVAAIPGIRGVAGISQAPVTGDGGVVSYYPADAPPESGEEPPRVRWRAVAAEYFRTAGIELVRGRGFAPSDAPGAEPVAVLSELAAEELFANSDPIGRRVITEFESEPVTVVGVVRDTRFLGPAEASLPMIYRPYPQTGSVFESFGWTSRAFVLRTSLPPGDLAAPVRAAVHDVDARALVTRFESLTEAIASTLSGRRTTLVLLVLFAGGALVLGAVGIYGVTGYLVRERRREIGVRIALGASGRRVIGEVLTDVLRIAGIGAAIGVAGALAASRLLRGLVVDLAAIDARVYAAAVLASVSVAVLAALLPARRAGHTDPIEVLAAEG